MSETKTELFPIDRLRTALDGRRCVSAWLGIGEVLFMGFGEEVLPERDDSGRRSQPTYELETNFADWSIQGGSSECSPDSDRLECEVAATALIGQRVVAWKLDERLGLTITFSGGSMLTIVPRSIPDVSLRDAWSMALPDNQTLPFRSMAGLPSSTPICL